MSRMAAVFLCLCAFALSVHPAEAGKRHVRAKHGHQVQVPAGKARAKLHKHAGKRPLAATLNSRRFSGKFHAGDAVGVTFHAEVGAARPAVFQWPEIEYRLPEPKKTSAKNRNSCASRQAAIVAREEGIRYQTIAKGKSAWTVHGYRNGVKAKIRISKRACIILD